MSALIEIVDLSKTYRDKRFRTVTALKAVNFSIYEGEAFGFIGPNGAGKSTTIKILTGILAATSGHAKVLGYPVEDPRSRQKLGFVPENACLYDYLTPLEILMMGAKLHGVSKPDLRQHCLSWLERFDIAEVANRRIRSFSKGMVQRTALAHALVIEPRLLILDEPLSGLDPVGRKEVVDVLLEYRQSGGTILFSSHVLHDVERLADRFGLIHKGVLQTVQRPDELVGGEASFVVRSIGSQSIPGMVRDTSERWFVQTSASNLWNVLERIRSGGHSIIEVKPSMSLEQAFLKFISNGTSSK